MTPWLLNGRRRIPGMPSEITEVDRDTLFPENRVRSTHSANRNSTRAGDTDNVPAIIDSGGGAGGIARQWRQFLHRAVGLPDHSPELQYLKRGIAGRIVNSILSPADNLPPIVCGGGVAVVPAREWR
jgi:hypothetical protein